MKLTCDLEQYVKRSVRTESVGGGGSEGYRFLKLLTRVLASTYI